MSGQACKVCPLEADVRLNSSRINLLERDVVANAETARENTCQVRALVDAYSSELTRIYSMLGEIQRDLRTLLGKAPV